MWINNKWVNFNGESKTQVNEAVNHPSHYGGESNPFEPIKIIDYYDLSFSCGNAIKYILRAGRKDGNSAIQDLEKAKWYIDHQIQKLEEYGYNEKYANPYQE